ncbi:hypothetical protein BDV97DRAFT_398841 [Delphinella strobiligena]|nr:hypothetical protein BDV97DRAFT_398841 [Delphinella strobiligena]
MVHTPRQKPVLEIVPNTRFIVFHGDQHEARPVKLHGVVRFTTPDPMSIKNVKIWLEGKRRISWFYMGGMAAGEVSDKKTFWHEERNLGTAGTHKINSGTIEWPFEFQLDPSMPESIEGMNSTYLVYDLHASVSRPGWNAKDIIAHSHLRLVRTLGPEQMETTRSRTNSDIWANKLSYSISIPTDAVVFGTSIVADVELSPIRKGIKLGKIEMRLIEAVTKRIQQSEVPDLRGDRCKVDETDVAKADMEFPEDSRVTFEDESPDNPTMEDEKYVFKAKLELPKSLRQCRQDVDSHNVNITHRFKLMVNIHNPEGHVSQLVCRLPVKLFISPNLPVDDQNMVQVGANTLTDLELNQQEVAINAPPEYGRHQLDALYNDINASGYMTRPPSGSSTPFYAQSRSASHENLHALSLNGLADMDHTHPQEGHFAPGLLRSRLANLADHGSSRQQRVPPIHHHSPSGGNTPHNGSYDLAHRSLPGAGSYFGTSFPPSNRSSPPHHSPIASIPQSRRASTEGAEDDLHQTDYDLPTLSRVPSYGAAVRTPGPVTPFIDGPPSYFEATSRPPSPGIARPSAAHMRSNTSTPGSATSLHTLRDNFAPLGVRADFNNIEHDDAHVRTLRARVD